MQNETDLIARSHFTTHALDPKQRYDAWEASISAVFDVNPTEMTLNQSFDAEVESYMIGTMFASRCKTNGQAFSRDKRAIARHNMDHILIQFYMQGGNTLITPDGIINTSPGDIQIIDMAQELNSLANPDHNMRGDVRPVFHNLSLVVARDRLEALMPALHTFHLYVLKANTPFNLILRNYIMAIYQNTPNLTVDEGGALVDPTVELLAATIGRAADTMERARGTLDLASLLTVKQFIDKNIEQPALGPDMIALHLGISRASLFRICKPVGGAMALVRTRRLLVARRLLSNASLTRSVKIVAYGLGFASPSSFARAYKQQFGISPTETRDLYVDSIMNRNNTGQDTSLVGDRKYESWIANLVS